MRSVKLPPISVCLLTYNRAALIERTIGGLLSQSHSDFELIINDDCSTDATEEICRRLAREDARIRYCRNPRNLRYANNQNAAITRATRELVAIVHDGDIYRRDMLERWTSALVEHPTAALVFSGAEHLDLDGRVIALHSHPYAPLTPGRVLFDEMLTAPGSPIFGIAMVRRTSVIEAGPFDPRMPTLADIDMWFRLLLHHDVAYVGAPLYQIAAREADHHNTFTNWKVRSEHELIFALNFRRRYLADPKGAEAMRRRIARMLWRISVQQCLSCLRHVELRAAREGFRHMLAKPPFGAAIVPDQILDWQSFAESLRAPSREPDEQGLRPDVA